MNDYEEIIKNIYKNILENYDLKYIPINDFSIALVGWKFAIIVEVSRDGVTLSYIMPDENGVLVEYWFDSFISSKFESSDRKDIGNPKTINEIITAELKISAKGLVNHWEDILRGDRRWIIDYENYELGGNAEKVNRLTSNILTPIFDKQVKI
ncbi:MAG: hypothetical protein PHX70_06180 [Clostridium sp.]|nr:hypothetical protein [Clostridium sp.]